jgi:hypothetical protein
MAPMSFLARNACGLLVCTTLVFQTREANAQVTIPVSLLTVIAQTTTRSPSVPGSVTYTPMRRPSADKPPSPPVRPTNPSVPPAAGASPPVTTTPTSTNAPAPNPVALPRAPVPASAPVAAPMPVPTPTPMPTPVPAPARAVPVPSFPSAPNLAVPSHVPNPALIPVGSQAPTTSAHPVPPPGAPANTLPPGTPPYTFPPQAAPSTALPTPAAPPHVIPAPIPVTNPEATQVHYSPLPGAKPLTVPPTSPDQTKPAPSDMTVVGKGIHPTRPERRIWGLASDLGMPDGMNLGLVLSPYDWVRLGVSAGTNSASLNYRGGLSLIPMGWGPSFSLEAGHCNTADTTSLINTFFSVPKWVKPYFQQLGYTYFNAHVGFDYSIGNFTLFAHSGYTYLIGTVRAPNAVVVDTTTNTSVLVDEGKVYAHTLSGKIGLIYLFGGS